MKRDPLSALVFLAAAWAEGVPEGLGPHDADLATLRLCGELLLRRASRSPDQGAPAPTPTADLGKAALQRGLEEVLVALREAQDGSATVSLTLTPMQAMGLVSIANRLSLWEGLTGGASTSVQHALSAVPQLVERLCGLVPETLRWALRRMMADAAAAPPTEAAR